MAPEGINVLRFGGVNVDYTPDGGTPLTDDYRLPFAFTGKLERVTFDLGPVQPMAAGK